MRVIETQRYGSGARKLLERARRESRPRTLLFGTPVADARAALEALSAGELVFSGRASWAPCVECLRASLWLWFDHDCERALGSDHPDP